jgi:geranylgeranyl transferase type-2 subunit beta
MLPMDPYLPRLTARLADGLAHRPAAFRDRHATYLAAAQQPDGGWPGREGGSDLYYTGFALRGLAALGALTPEVAGRAADYLRGAIARPAGVVDFFSFLYAVALVQLAGGGDVLADSPPDWPERVAGTLESLRAPDGGYAKQPGGPAGSTYNTFLVGLCYQLLGRSLPDPEAAVRFVRARRRDDGGFVEVAPQRRNGTNPTAAAIGVLQIADALDDETRVGAAEFLLAMPSFEGGLRANDRVPLADLLSTFTGCWTLAELGVLDQLNLDALRRYAEDQELPAGGFRGGVWDEAADVEYTFYGLGTIALADTAAEPQA